MNLPLRKRGQTTRVCDPTLPNLLASALPAKFKMRVIELLTQLKPLDRLDGAAIRSNSPELLASVEQLSSAGLDLFRVLRLEPPERTTYSRHNIGCQLRYKRTRLGRPAVETDYPAGHAVPLLACVFWGGMERWAADANDRQQKPKGYWHVHEHQLAALRAYLDDHPGTPITQLRLSSAGYPALAKAVTLTGLKALVSELGLQRDLRRPERGHWTSEMVIASFVALCRSHDRTLTSHDLQLMGREGHALRGRIARVFADWQSFRVAVAAVHADMPAEGLPIAADRTLLDSWSEVAVYQALRAALPADVPISPHVLLGEDRCSCDFVIDGRVVVEVLMLSRAEISDPRSDLQVAYARKWQRKAALYATRGTLLVVVEPVDIGNAAALAAKVTEVTQLLDLSPPAIPIVVTAQVRPKGWWSFSRLCLVVAEVADEVGRFPTLEQLANHGYSHAANMLRHRGWRARVSAAIGRPTKHRRPSRPIQR